MSFFGLGVCKANTCGACGSADPLQDTLQVHLPLDDKENVVPIYAQGENETKVAAAVQLTAVDKLGEQESAAQKRAREEAEESARQEAEVRARREAQERARAESQRLALEQQRRRKAEEAALERRAQEIEEERRRRAAEELEENRRQALQAAAERRQREEEALAAINKEKMVWFLKAHGYTGVNAKRTRMMKTKYALHTAVKHRDAEMVALLLRAGASPSVTNSAGHTPLQLAQKSKDDALIAAFTLN